MRLGLVNLCVLGASLCSILAGCGIKLVNPRNNPNGMVVCSIVGSPGPCPTPALVTWSPSGTVLTGFKFTVDGVDQTAAFTIDNVNQQATATLSLTIATHTLVASCTNQQAFFVVGDSATINVTPWIQ